MGRGKHQQQSSRESETKGRRRRTLGGEQAVRKLNETSQGEEGDGGVDTEREGTNQPITNKGKEECLRMGLFGEE